MRSWQALMVDFFLFAVRFSPHLFCSVFLRLYWFFALLLPPANLGKRHQFYQTLEDAKPHFSLSILLLPCGWWLAVTTSLALPSSASRVSPIFTQVSPRVKRALGVVAVEFRPRFARSSLCFFASRNTETTALFSLSFCCCQTAMRFGHYPIFKEHGCVFGRNQKAHDSCSSLQISESCQFNFFEIIQTDFACIRDAISIAKIDA